MAELLRCLKEYQRVGAVAQYRATDLLTWRAWSSVGFAVLAVENRLTELGLGQPGPGALRCMGASTRPGLAAMELWMLLSFARREGRDWGRAASGPWAVPMDGRPLPDTQSLIEQLTRDLAELTCVGEQQPASRQQAPAAPPGSPDARHSIDFRSVRWYGTDYVFTKNQAAVVKLLWEAWENGTPEVGGDTLLAEADCDTKRLDHLFDLGKHRAWGTMIRPGPRQGSYRLTPPEGKK